MFLRTLEVAMKIYLLKSFIYQFPILVHWHIADLQIWMLIIVM